MRHIIQHTLFILLFFWGLRALAQQDPQFTQYMYNTITINPAYTGSRGHMAITGVNRSQWVGINGSPTTQSLSIDSPSGNNVGLGFVVINDALGPANETHINGNFSYTVQLNDATKKLSFGLKAGGRLFNVDFSRGSFENPDRVFQNNIRNQFFASIGGGIYYHTEKSYLGISVPNFLAGTHYDKFEEAVNVQDLHYFVIGGTVIDLRDNLKFKPAFFVKWVTGAPFVADVSANFLIKDTLTLGAAYRWNDAFSGLVGLQLSSSISLGYAYDMTATELKQYNSGTHELFLRFELKPIKRKLKSPRFY